MPRERPARGGSRFGSPGLARRDHRDGVGRADGPREALAFGGREHRLRILERAGRPHDVCCRECERDVEASVVQVELAAPDVRLVVPAAYVVEHRHARIPLRDLVERAVPSHSARAVFRDRGVPGDVEHDLIAGIERDREVDPHCGAEHLVRQVSPTSAHGLEGDAPGEPEAGEVERNLAEDQRRLVELVGHAVRCADVLLEEEPEIREALGRVVAIPDRLVSRQDLPLRVQRRVNRVIGALLPVLRSRAAVAGAIHVRRREIELPKARRVLHLRRQLDGGGEKEGNGDHWRFRPLFG